MKPPKKAIFVDIDGTITKESAYIVYLKQLLNNKKIPFVDKVKLTFLTLIKVKFHIPKKIIIRESLVKPNKKELSKFLSSIKNILNTRTIEYLNKVRKNYDYVIIASATPYYLAEAFKLLINANDALCTKIKSVEKNGKHYAIVEQINNHFVKRNNVKKYASKHNINLKKSLFITNSIDDYATSLLFKPTNIILVNPDPLMKFVTRIRRINYKNKKATLIIKDN